MIFFRITKLLMNTNDVYALLCRRSFRYRDTAGPPIVDFYILLLYIPTTDIYIPATVYNNRLERRRTVSGTGFASGKSMMIIITNE